MPEEMFVSEVSPDNRLGGVFEYDGETSYFYLYRMPERGDDGKVLDFIHVTSRVPTFRENDVSVRWSIAGDVVGLFIFGQLWAAYRASGQKYGGDYKAGGVAHIPEDIRLSFTVPE